MENFEKPLLKFYSLYSKSLAFYNAPFIASSDVEALLTVRNAIASGQIPPHVVEDCSLFAVGFFDTSTGSFADVVVPVKLCDLIDIHVGGETGE